MFKCIDVKDKLFLDNFTNTSPIRINPIVLDFTVD